MIHYENMTKDRIISLLKDTLEYAEEKDKEIERLTKQNKALNEMYELTKKKYIRLNNIINELEKEFDKELENLGYREEKLYTQGIHDTIINHKYLLQELKGSDKE